MTRAGAPRAPVLHPGDMDTEPLPFHRLARGGQFSWWRPLTGVVLAIALVMVSAIVLTFAALAAGSVTGLPRTAGHPRHEAGPALDG